MVELKYIEEFRVLLCATCEYCVLPSALDRHLKCIHRLPTSHRAKFSNQVQDWDLARAEDVQYPGSDHSPIDGLPVLQGFACSAPDCDHLCATTKRMQAHWREEHYRLRRFLGDGGFRCTSVSMQTFFRSSNLRYFVVNRRKRGGSNHPIEFSAVIEPVPDLIRSPTSHETTKEWMLTKQFYETGYNSLVPVKGTWGTWRDGLLRVCHDAEYMRCAMLSLTASHIAYSHQNSRDTFAAEADSYRQMAISKFPVRSSSIDEGMFCQVFNFQRLMTLCCMARMQAALIDDKKKYLQSIDILPDWVIVQRSGNALIWPLRGKLRIVHALQGPVDRLFAMERLANNDFGNSLNPHDHRLRDLQDTLGSFPANVIDPACVEALVILRRVWSIPYKEDVAGFRDMALRFTVKVSDRYIDLVREYDPFALIVFAYFAVLLGLAEDTYWYVAGHAETLLEKIIEHLPLEWQYWIAWPISMLFSGSDDTIG